MSHGLYRIHSIEIHSTMKKLSLLLLLLVPASLFAQGANGRFGNMFFNANVGSFKILGPGDDMAEGTLTFNCKGSVLISGLQGTVTAQGLRREINDEKLGKQVYFGQGKMTIKGKWNGIQFFGRDLRATWNGFGIIRLFGEFDKNLSTGEYWFSNDPERKPWFNGGMTLTNPPAQRTGATGVKPRVRDNKGNQ